MQAFKQASELREKSLAEWLQQVTREAAASLSVADP
jgi:hypothetical protein